MALAEIDRWDCGLFTASLAIHVRTRVVATYMPSRRSRRSRSGPSANRGVVRLPACSATQNMHLAPAFSSPAPATENITALTAGGCHLILFATGVGNSIGNPVSPTVKICGNSRTCRTFAPHIDLNLSGVLDGGLPLTVAGASVKTLMYDIASGRSTCCETLGETEVAISRIGESV